MKYIWAIDTPWAKKGAKVGECLSSFNNDHYVGSDLVPRKLLLELGWIKPVEEKKLTEEEILEAITHVVGHHEVSARRLAKLLAEHLKN